VGAKRIPEDVAAAILESWPGGVIEEFDTEESYFHDVHAAPMRDLRKIPGAALVWQTEAEPDRADWHDDDDDDDSVSFADYARFEDGGHATPDPFNSGYFYSGYYNDTGKPVDTAESYRNDLGESAFAKLENLWDRIAKVLPKQGVTVLDQAIPDLPAPDLRHAGQGFLEGKKLSVRDTFLFRGV
jgi:hypothetical protein